MIEQAARRRPDLDAFPREPGALARALEQFHAQGALQRLDLLAQGRLRQAEALGCPAEMTFLRERP